jgi:hypothetical protein
MSRQDIYEAMIAEQAAASQEVQEAIRAIGKLRKSLSNLGYNDLELITMVKHLRHLAGKIDKELNVDKVVMYG